MLVSTIIEDGLRSQRGSDHIPSESEVTALDSVNSIIKSLADMIKNRVPLPEDFNPLKGSDFREGDEKKVFLERAFAYVIYPRTNGMNWMFGTTLYVSCVHVLE
ncbi:hypothetical protein VKT23_015257 [Stygiomarasmius scandens]|uniref:Uncharacterized protein n=1 Tax=Marasmiellus scandens TaxID=2682957 RepID=A0ABR1J321_9AGAR